MTRTARALTSTLVAGLLLAACGAAPDGVAEPAGGPDGARDGTATASGSPTPTPSASPTGPAAPTAESVRTQGTVVQVDGRTVLHAMALDEAAGVITHTDGDVVVLGVGPAEPPGPVGVVLAAPTDGDLVLQDDGSFVVLAPDGAFLGGGARPVTAEGGEPVTITEVGDALVRASAGAGALRVRVGGRALLGAEWGEREGGRSLAVSPSPWARESGQAGELGVWTELVAAVPEAGTAVMRDQLTCHALGAPDKRSWNLEPWRPDVGLFAVLAAACNPT